MTKTAGGILCYLVSSIGGENEAHCELAGLSKAIQKECSFNKKMADRLDLKSTAHAMIIISRLWKTSKSNTR